MFPEEREKLKNFIILLAGQTVSQFGTAMTSFAAIIWIYTKEGTVLSSSLLGVCSLLPYLLVGLFGGSITDRCSKKKIMLVCDSVAAAGTAILLACFAADVLHLWVLCAVNILSGFMNAFQKPASLVVTSLLIPKRHYVRIGGLQSSLSAMSNIFVPVLASGILAFGGLGMVLALDLLTFCFAFLTLLLLVKIPKTEGECRARGLKSMLSEIKESVSFLSAQEGLRRIIVIYAVLNFFGALSFDSMMQPLVLARTGGSTISVGIVSAVMAASHLLAGILVAVLKPAKRKTAVMFAGCLLAFAGITFFGIGASLPWWVVTVSAGCLGMPFYFSYETAIVREIVPISHQGRIFSLKEMLVQGLTMLGFLCGALLADYVFEPLMLGDSPLQRALSPLFGTGRGAGMGLLFSLSGLTGFVLTLILKRNPALRQLDLQAPSAEAAE